MDLIGRKYCPMAHSWEQDYECLSSKYRGKFLYIMNYYIDLLILEKHSAPRQQSLTKKTVTKNVTSIEKHLVSPVG